jgi:murein DD-endopeptidase MepM/ murein hydrolase activator NlpD
MAVRFRSPAFFKKMRKTAILILMLGMLNFYGCASVPIEPLPKTTVKPGSIYHRVEKGQTLWRIAKIYSVDIDELVKANRIADTSNIEIGQAILIPRKPDEKPAGIPVTAEEFAWPLKGKVISSYGQVNGNLKNKGINIQAQENAKVIASRSGKVIFYGPLTGGFGKTIIIDHGDGYSTLYARNAEVFVKPGELVVKNAAIAKAGSAGRDKNTYLHFEIRKGHSPQNPGFYLP